MHDYTDDLREAVWQFLTEMERSKGDARNAMAYLGGTRIELLPREKDLVRAWERLGDLAR